MKFALILLTAMIGTGYLSAQEPQSSNGMILER